MLLTPFCPLPAGDPAYVDCTEVRGDGDILVSESQSSSVKFKFPK